MFGIFLRSFHLGCAAAAAVDALVLKWAGFDQLSGVLAHRWCDLVALLLSFVVCLVVGMVAGPYLLCFPTRRYTRGWSHPLVLLLSVWLTCVCSDEVGHEHK